MHSRDSQFTLLEATRVVARGSELDSKLDALCGYVVNSGASEAIVYLFDPVNQVLVPAAHAGVPENPLTALADLCAVAIRQARLENALLEKADWIGRLANTDPLTGLANRVTFERMLELEIARATRQETQLSVLLFDIDGFAQINESAGAEMADDVLRFVAATLAGQVRLVDTVARFGPDEFAMIAPGGGGEIAGRRISNAMAMLEAGGSPVTVGVGVVVFPQDGATSEELISGANAALAEAKRRGRGAIVARGGS
jgi:diguanylate cyclase (GGDEF)-like protein